MEMGSLVIALLLLYLGLMVFLGIRGRKYASSFQSSITAGKSASLLLLVGGAIGSHVGSGFVIGGAEYGAQYGIGGAWYGLGCGLSYLVTSVFFVSFFYRNKYLSLSDFFLHRYQHYSLRIIATVAIALNSMAVFAGQLLAGKAIFYVAGINGNQGIAVTAVTVFIYATISGLWGAMAAASMQTAVIFLAVVASILVLFMDHGSGILVTSLPDSFFNMVPFSGEFLVMLTVPTILSSLNSQHTIQRTASAKSERDAVLSHIIAGLLMIPIALVPALIGMYGRSFYPDTPIAEIFSKVASERLPFALGALLLAAVLCAVITTCNSVLVSLSTVVVHDVIQEIVYPQISERQSLIACGVINFAVSVTGAFLAIAMDNIIELMSLGYTFVTAGCLIPFLGGIVWKRGTVQGAVASSVLGIGFVLLDFTGILSLPYASVTPLIPAALGYIVVSLVTKPRDGAAPGLTGGAS